jgi:hypothetical protein
MVSAFSESFKIFCPIYSPIDQLKHTGHIGLTWPGMFLVTLTQDWDVHGREKCYFLKVGDKGAPNFPQTRVKMSHSSSRKAENKLSNFESNFLGKKPLLRFPWGKRQLGKKEETTQECISRSDINFRRRGTQKNSFFSWLARPKNLRKKWGEVIFKKAPGLKMPTLLLWLPFLIRPRSNYRHFLGEKSSRETG